MQGATIKEPVKLFTVLLINNDIYRLSPREFENWFQTNGYSTPLPPKKIVGLSNKKIFRTCLLTLLCNRNPLIERGVFWGLGEVEVASRNGGCLQVMLTKHFLKFHKMFCGLGKEFRIPTLIKTTCHKIFRGAADFN